MKCCAIVVVFVGHQSGVTSEEWILARHITLQNTGITGSELTAKGITVKKQGWR